ncbi:hypothetical protein N7452_001352 [Penicillium brevicompactum]|uniref:Uncharacterized protein n=1 Tax=Penicillium brevicompactum TaxID=5074 RepID=A0A9W9R7V2_PENBR|nr:hypothetical protein N7452_001352 [Penicillium brevicompactum]
MYNEGISMRLGAPPKGPLDRGAQRWPLRLRHTRAIKPASYSQWVDETRWPYLVDTFLELSNQSERYVFPDSESEDPDLKPPGDPLSEDEEVDPQEIIDTDDFPGYAGPIDLKALRIKAESHLMSCSTSANSGNAEETEVSEDSSSNDSDDWPFPEFRHVSQTTRGTHRSHHLLNNEAKVGKHAATIPTETSTNDHIPE